MTSFLQIKIKLCHIPHWYMQVYFFLAIYVLLFFLPFFKVSVNLPYAKKGFFFVSSLSLPFLWKRGRFFSLCLFLFPSSLSQNEKKKKMAGISYYSVPRKMPLAFIQRQLLLYRICLFCYTCTGCSSQFPQSSLDYGLLI